MKIPAKFWRPVKWSVEVYDGTRCDPNLVAVREIERTVRDETMVSGEEEEEWKEVLVGDGSGLTRL